MALNRSVRYLQVVAILAASTGGEHGAMAQDVSPFKALREPAPPMHSICVLQTDGIDRGESRPQPAGRLGKAASTATVLVTYSDSEGEPWPTEATDAFAYAAQVWESVLVSSVPIKVRAGWSDLGPCQSGAMLGSGGPLLVWRDFSGAALSATWYPDALADAMHGSSMNSNLVEPDVVVDLNRNCDDPGATYPWYFGTDANPSPGSVDFVSVALHEIGHGIGFVGSASIVDGMGSVLLNGYPQSFDRRAADADGTPLLSDSYPDGSAELAAVLEAGASSVFFGGSSVEAANAGLPAMLYSPSPFSAGSSYSHFDEDTFNGTESALMTPYLGTQEAGHVIGSVTCGLLGDIGWATNSASCSASLAVELSGFSAKPRDEAIDLYWSTSSETNSALFQVEHRTTDESFQAMGTVPAAALSNEPRLYTYRVENVPSGRHSFRLRQIDTAGHSTYSEVIQVFVPGRQGGVVAAPFPNPVRSRTTLPIAVPSAQNVRAEAFDLLGRRVAVLFEGPLLAEEPFDLPISTQNWSAGTYVIVVSGEMFSEAVSLAVLP